MPTYKIQLRNIKGIRSLEMEYPNKPGVYLISGRNGCGKTTLLVSLDRLRNKNAFAQYFSPTPLYNYQSAKITYSADSESVTYEKVGIRWMLSPKPKKKTIDLFPPTKSIMITTSGIRFFTQQGNIAGARTLAASDFIKDSMNMVFSTHSYSNLKYRQIKPMRGRVRKLPRSNKLYVMDVGGKKYDENNFSLGERLVLNTLELITDAEAKSQILIDEIELALHPVAQANFYRLLKKLAQEKSLYIFISSHSATLVKCSSHTIHLSRNSSGVVTVSTNSYPAYILGDIGIDANYRPDKILFVEDIMAAEYVRNIINTLINEININLICNVIPVGGYPQVVEFLRNYRSIEPDLKKTHALLDEDAKTSLEELKHKDATDSLVIKMEEEFENKHLDYLDITPEMGFWDWIFTDPTYFKNLISVDFHISLGAWDADSEIRRIEGLPPVLILERQPKLD